MRSKVAGGSKPCSSISVENEVAPRPHFSHSTIPAPWSGRVEDGRGGDAPFPIPAHQTGRADFPHPAFRLASLQSTRQQSQVEAPELEYAERTKHRFAGEAVGAVRGHLVTSDQKASDPLVDVVVN